MIKFLINIDVLSQKFYTIDKVKLTLAGKRIVLTADRSLMTNYRGNFLYGFIACGPYEVLPEWVFDKVFCPPVETDPNTGEAKVAQVGLRRVESALLQGYKRDEILTVNPDYIEKSIGSDTKIVGINVMDPLVCMSLISEISCMSFGSATTPENVIWVVPTKFAPMSFSPCHSEVMAS